MPVSLSLFLLILSNERDGAHSGGAGSTRDGENPKEARRSQLRGSEPACTHPRPRQFQSPGVPFSLLPKVIDSSDFCEVLSFFMYISILKCFRFHLLMILL